MEPIFQDGLINILDADGGINIMSISEYDIKYSKDDYFNNRKWINNVYVKTIISKANIPRSAYLLDVGCGQGHFSYLFNKHGIQVLGIDLSKTGIQFAKYHYEKKGLHFEVTSVQNSF